MAKEVAVAKVKGWPWQICQHHISVEIFVYVCHPKAKKILTEVHQVFRRAAAADLLAAAAVALPRLSWTYKPLNLPTDKPLSSPSLATLWTKI